MPQKAIFSRTPLISCRMCTLSNGQIRTDDPIAERLYGWLQAVLDNPEIWEGAFTLACQLRDRPLEEPVTGLILSALEKEPEGALPGDYQQQLRIARAAMAVYEENLNHSILRKLASWCEMLELQWDMVSAERSVRIQPGDWMEFLVRFYRLTGIKAVLRLCTRLRATAMDWTTLLHSFHQRKPLSAQLSPEEIHILMKDESGNESDFMVRQALINRAELLADGIRYAAYSGIFSGNGQELSAGEKGWSAVNRDHGAVCGGTTADVLLAGKATNRGIYAAAIAAWTEAFISQAMLQGAPWAMDALSRIVHNALPACIGAKEPVMYQRVNSLREDPGSAGCAAPEDGTDSVHVLARLARALGAARKAAVTAMPEGFSLNLSLPGMYVLGLGNEMISVRISGTDAVLRSSNGLRGEFTLFLADTEIRPVRVQMGEQEAETKRPEQVREGTYLLLKGDGSRSCRISYGESEHLVVLSTHHEGICCFSGPRLLTLEARNGTFRTAACGEPVLVDGQPMIPVCDVSGWINRDGIPADVPVLPKTEGETRLEPMYPYSETPVRIAVFPRARA